jgi:hypothetical protein
MSSATQPVSVLLMRSACDFAFRVGQLAETILIQRAIELAKGDHNDGVPVTEEHVKESLDDSIVNDILARLEDNHDEGETEGRRLSA